MRHQICFKAFSLALCVSGFSQNALAQSPSYPTGEIVVVTAARTPQPLARVGQSITIIDAAEIERRQTNNVADLLRTVPGVTITRNGGVGTTTSVYIRGAESNQTVALIDGIKLNDPSSPGSGFNFGSLLIGNIERIEVLRGPASVLWGSDAIGGVVNMITRQPTDDLNINVRGEYGYRNTAQLVGSVSGKHSGLSMSAGAGWFRTKGISAFSEARGGKERDGYENFGVNANLNLAATDWFSLDARTWYSDASVNIDGFPAPSFAFGDVNEDLATRELVGYLGANATLFEGRFKNRLGYAFTNTRRRNVSYEGTPAETFNGEGRNERLDYQGTFDINEKWQANAGVESERSQFTTSSFGANPSSAKSQIDGVYGQIVAMPISDLTLTLGLRYDNHSSFGDATTFGASGVYNLTQTQTTFRASYAQGFKAPSLFQLRSNFGNSSLMPERSDGWDFGITQRLVGDVLQLNATYFQRTTSALITFISCPVPRAGLCTNRPSGTYDNIAKAKAEGLEMGVTLALSKAMILQANYSFTDATNISPGNANFGRQLVRRPQDRFTGLVDYRFNFGLELGATLTHIGSSFDNANNSRKVVGYALLDVRASYPVTDKVSLYARVENVTDEVYETIFRYGSPGRGGYIGARLAY